MSDALPPPEIAPSTTTLRTDDDYSAGFKDGVLFGLRVALHADNAWIIREIRKLEERSGRAVDGEPEWRSWNIDPEMGIVERAKLQRRSWRDK